MNIVKTLSLAAVLAASAASANAAVVYATSVDSYVQGTNTITGGFIPARAITANATGAPDGNMLSLGFGGSAIVSFGTKFIGPGKIWEITFGNKRTGTLPYIETVKVSLGLNGIFTYIGNVSNTTAVTGDSFNFAGTFDQILLEDISPLGPERDGFDIDAISVTAVPVPAAGLLLLSAIGAVAAVRRRSA
jgi:hypothetical protein